MGKNIFRRSNSFLPNSKNTTTLVIYKGVNITNVIAMTKIITLIVHSDLYLTEVVVQVDFNVEIVSSIEISITIEEKVISVVEEEDPEITALLIKIIMINHD